MFPEPYPAHIVETNKSHCNLAPLHPLTISIKTGFTTPANEGDSLDQPTCYPLVWYLLRWQLWPKLHSKIKRKEWHFKWVSLEIACLILPNADKPVL